ncbi:phosphopeptide-binding protein [Nostocales cyanobacterium HT-58-2]|nr:phosphopeptide-binding protein [Nostocales cyanobacterium HT-58-2]
MQNPGKPQTTGLNLELFHVQSDTSFELPQNFSMIRIGKPKDKIMPDINVSGLPNADFVSRLHAEIHVEKNTYYLLDMGSANGTYLNNIKLAPTKRYPLNFGDKIDLGHGGRVTFIFLHKQDELVSQSDNTVLNNPPTVIQIELTANAKPSPMERLSKLVGLGLMVAGVLILAANTHISLSVRIPGVVLCIAGVGILTWRRAYHNLGWFLIALGITVMLFTANAFALLSLVALLLSCSLLVAGYQLFTTGKIFNYSLRSRNY